MNDMQGVCQSRKNQTVHNKTGHSWASLTIA